MVPVVASAVRIPVRRHRVVIDVLERSDGWSSATCSKKPGACYPIAGVADRTRVALHSGQLTFDMSAWGDSNSAPQFVHWYSYDGSSLPRIPLSVSKTGMDVVNLGQRRGKDRRRYEPFTAGNVFLPAGACEVSGRAVGRGSVRR